MIKRDNDKAYQPLRKDLRLKKNSKRSESSTMPTMLQLENQLLLISNGTKQQSKMLKISLWKFEKGFKNVNKMQRSFQNKTLRS